MFYIMLERKTHLAKPSQVPPWAWHSTALWTIDWGWILGNIQIWLVSAPSTAYLSEIIESYGNAKRPTRDHQRDWNTDCTILHIPVAHVQVSPGTEHLQAKLSIGTPYPWSKRTRQCRSKGPRVGNPQHTGFFKTLKKTFPTFQDWMVS